MADESFDLEEFDKLAAQPTVTAWSSQISKAKSSRTYGRRGSTGALPRMAKLSRYEEPLDALSPTASEEEFGQIAEIEGKGLPIFKPDVPTIPGRRKFVRANSMGDHLANKRSYPVLRRTMSVSNSTDFSENSSGHSLSSGPENMHPNLHAKDLASPPKRAAYPLETRGRKKSRPLVPANEGLRPSESFTNLAREEATWAKNPVPPPPPSSIEKMRSLQNFTGDFNDLEFFESSSPAFSSVCSNRKRGICDSPFLDEIDDQSIGGSFRMSRSSLMSPPSRVVPEFNLDAMENPKDIVNKKQDLTDIASDDGDSAQDSKEDSDDEKSFERRESGMKSPMPMFIPFNERQKRGSLMPVIPTLRRKVLAPKTASVDDVINSMTSYQDLKYLMKRLRAQREGSVCWHVALPNAWGEEQRRQFIQWITTSLGFTHRKAGAQAAYFQIPKSKGMGILKLLEESIAVCRKRGIGSKTPTNTNTERDYFTFASSHFVTKTPVNAVSVTPKMTSMEKSNDLDVALMQAMGSFGIDDKSPKAPEPESLISVPKRITLEDTCELSLQPPRHSMENHSSSYDLMAHMHGLTPVPKPALRPPRLSIGSVATQGTVSKYAAVSPFVIHHPPSTIGSTTKCFTHDFSTPMMQTGGWGSCPVEGRDWGASEGVDALVMQDLMRMLDRSLYESGVPATNEEEIVDEPRQFSLDLELEAAGQEPMNDSSPEISSRRENSMDFGQEGSLAGTPTSVHAGFDNLTPEFQFPQRGKDTRAFKRRQTAFEKRQRMSLFASAVNPAATLFNNARKSLFVRPSRKCTFHENFDRSLRDEHIFERETLISPVETRPVVWHEDEGILKHVFSFLTEPDLLRTSFLVSTRWADLATSAHAELMLLSVGCKPSDLLASDSGCDDEEEGDESNIGGASGRIKDTPTLLDRPWNYLVSTFPWARFLAEGGFKTVYKVFNYNHRREEAISVMDVDCLNDAGEINMVGMELAVSAMLSSLVRRGVCPNFVMMRGAFSCQYKPPETFWGSEDNKFPRGEEYVSPLATKKLRPPKKKGRYQFIRMELCEHGDAEEYIKTLPEKRFKPEAARQMLFQMAYALHTAAIRFSLKHYDVKLLNYFVQGIESGKSGETVLRYSLGNHVFALRSPTGQALLAKLADFGTANVDSASNGQQVTIAQFTTLENTPVDFFILGDKACQGHGHDNFGLGLCMLHLFTGVAPYEELLEKVTCPPNLKQRLREVWENEDEEDFSIIRGVILSDVVKDETGHITEGEPKEVLYDTFYRFLVLFGLPDVSLRIRSSKVWAVVVACLDSCKKAKLKGRTKKTDAAQYNRDCRKYSLDHGIDKNIARARCVLQEMDGGMDLLKGLVSFDPNRRCSALDVMNSTFMIPLRESPGQEYGPNDDVRTFSYASFPKNNTYSY